VLLNLPEVAHERLPRPPVKTMLGQVRFPPILGIQEPKFIAPFQEALRSEYPELQTEQQIGLLMTPEGAFQTDASKHWRVTTTDGAWAVVLATDFVTLEATAPSYTHYEDFRARFERMWSAVLEVVRPTRCAQQGLRYINHIERDLPPSGWRAFINNELLGAIGSEVFGDELEQAICDFRLQRPDGQLVIKHGVVRAGPERTLGYLLDFDYFAQQLGEDLSHEAVLRRFDTFHEIIYRLFRWSVTEEAIHEFKTV
jgi:uncharacterized protein (TIGR04255 family)